MLLHWRSLSLGVEMRQGSIAKLAAAQQLAAIHASEHAAALKAVNDELETQIGLINSQPDDKVSADEKAAQVRQARAAADNQRSELNGAYDTTAQQDQAAIFAQTVGGKWDTAVNQMVKDWGDMTSKTVSVFRNTMDSLNDNLIKEGEGHQTSHMFAQSVRQSLGHGAEGLAKAGLEKSESGILGAFGLGGMKKADGSASSPFHVIMAGVSNVASAAGGSIASAASGGGGGIFGSITGIMKGLGVPFLAGGGDAMAGQPHVIGEEGPELFVPRVSGKVVPNGKFGGSTTHPVHVDARGSTHPAETEAAVHRAMSKYMKPMMSGAVSAVKEQQRRSPLSKR